MGSIYPSDWEASAHGSLLHFGRKAGLAGPAMIVTPELGSGSLKSLCIMMVEIVLGP